MSPIGGFSPRYRQNATQPGIGCGGLFVPWSPGGAAQRRSIRRVAEGRSGLMLQDILPVELASYGVQLQCEREARASGYSELK
jgi:hypothetical protein